MVDNDSGLQELDSELDNFLAEIDDIEQSKEEVVPPEPEIAVWRECLDETTKHPYYWHTHTQQVTWIKPDNYDKDLVAYNQAMRQWKKKCEVVKQRNEERKKRAEEKKREAEIEEAKPKPVLVPPRTAPKVELENNNKDSKQTEKIGKMGKFNFMKSEEEKKESSNAPTNARLTFKVKQKTPEPDHKSSSDAAPPAFKKPKVSQSSDGKSENLPVKQRTVTEIAAEIKKKKQQIAITNARLLLQKRVEEQVAVKKKAAEEKEEREERSVPQLENKKRRIFQEVKVTKAEVDIDVKQAIEKERTILKEKLEFLGGDINRLSKFQVHIIALDTRISDFCDGHISESYMQSKLTELGQMLCAHEENSVPKNWTCTFDREEKRYRYTNKLTGKSQLTHPGEDDDKSSSSDSDSDSDDAVDRMCCSDDNMKVDDAGETSDKDDELYELFQQEIKVIEDKTREKTPETPPKKKKKQPPKSRESTPVSKPQEEKGGSTPAVAAAPAAPPMPPAEPPAPVLPNVPAGYDPYYVDPWAGYNGYNMMMGHPFPEVPPPPPPPPDDGMMEAYSPGNSDSEQEPEKEDKPPDDNLGVVSVKAPMRYSTPPTPAVDTSQVRSDQQEESGAGEESLESPDKEETVEETKPSKPVLKKKKKKVEMLNLSGPRKKKKDMNSLVAKWNKANKNADVAMK